MPGVTNSPGWVRYLVRQHVNEYAVHQTNQLPVYPWARQLVGDDFWDGLGAPFGGAEITVTVELTGFHTDPKAKALLSHCVISQEPLVARLTYCYRPRAGVAPARRAKPGRLRRLSLWWQSWKRLDRRRIEKHRQQYLYRCPGSACRHRC